MPSRIQRPLGATALAADPAPVSTRIMPEVPDLTPSDVELAFPG